jgi:3-hydroxyisobutyrate dehydrogenase-like beta-hydroxyacid dehydrogenase
MSDVTVIGLGPMGLALAELLVRRGRRVTLWNRTADKARPLVSQGAMLARSPAAAIAASPVTLVCVYDYAAAEAILTEAASAGALGNRLVVNLGTGGPDEAESVESLVHGHGGRYLDGAIQAAPSQMGRDDTPLFLSGPETDFIEAEPLLRVLAGNIVYLGSRIDAAAYMDLATLSHVYGAYAGFLHGAHIAEATGIDVGTYGNLVNAISPSFGAFFQHQGAVIASGDFRATESPLRISVPAVRRILRTSERLGLNTEVPALVDGWLQRASAAGMADEELAALIRILRAGPAPALPG